MNQSHLKSILHYDPETGVFRWLQTLGRRALAGQVAGTIDGLGYRRIKVKGKPYLSHRLAWLYMVGKFPEREIDHINRDKADNRYCNLRDVSHSINSRNKGLRSDNTSGVTGVHYNASKKRWVAYVSVGGKEKDIIVTPDFKEAVRARREAELKYY